MSSVYDTQKSTTVRISLLLISSSWTGLEAVTRDGRGTESGALGCLRVQVVKRKQISAKGGRDKGERGGSLAEVAKRGMRMYAPSRFPFLLVMM